jgi:hypothetical protein
MSPGRSVARARTFAARAVYEVGTVVGRVPALAMPIARWRGQGVPLDRSTEVVIEGYPRSANTLMVETFARSQSEPVKIAHHVHSPAHVLEAARRDLPTLVLIREPEAAAVELVLAKPAITLAQALRGWVRFYAVLRSRRSAFVIATFTEVHEDPGAPIGRLNDRFGTAFALPTDATREAAVRGVAERGYAGGPGLPLIGGTSPVHGDAAAERERLLERCRAPNLTSLRRRAELVYRSFAPSG